MEVRVVKEFRERDAWAVIHREGDILNVEAERAAELLVLGLVEMTVPATEDEAPASAKRASKKRRE